MRSTRRQAKTNGAWPAARALAAAAVLLAAVARPCPANELEQLSRSIVAINCNVPGTGSFLGTGVVIEKSGYVLTSTTVVPPGAANVRCHFIGALNVPARLVVADEKLELALLKLDPPAGTPAVVLRDSRDVAVGDTVFTLGDAFVAFALSGRFTTSFGIVSGRYALTRQLAPQKVYQGPVLETTATLAAGMDGGPLFDAAGHLIGVLSLNVHPARWLGTAVPTEALLGPLRKAVADDAKAHGAAAALTVNGPGRPLYPERVFADAQFRRSADRVAPSVVAIEVDRASDRKPAGNQRRQPRPQAPGPYAEILKRPDAPVTGLLIDRDGHVLTTWFNVWGKLRGAKVIVPGVGRAAARVIAHDEFRDLAMLKFDPADLGEGAADRLTPATFSPQPLYLASPVAAVGRSPDPDRFTLTTGIVSATGRLDGAAVQIDAAADYGNAGGPIIDAAGRVVGLVAHVRPDAVWSQNSGVGLAVTSASIREVLAELKAGKSIAKPQRGYIGIQMSSGSVQTVGVVVERVMPGTPGEEAGLKKGDLISEVDGRPVADAADLTRLIRDRKPGDQIVLTVRRGQQTEKVTVTLDEHPYQ